MLIVNDDQLRETLSAALGARRAGRQDEATRLFHLILSSGIEHPLALNALGIGTLARHDFATAADLFARAIAVDPTAPELRMNLARAHRGRGDEEAERAALDAALAIDQRHFMALVRLAEWHERHDENTSAAERWGHVLAMAPGLSERTAAIEAMLEHARSAVAQHHAAFAARIDAALATVHDGLHAADRRRVDACIDHVLGRRQIYANQCAGMHFPFLPADEFFERRHFPWIEDFEAQTDTIRDEFLRVMAEDAGVIRPYVAMKPGTPQNKWSPLDGSLAWSAMHLWKDGRRDETVCARVPHTTEVVEALPLSDLPGQTPTVFFSILRPGTHLPPHTGVSNVRAIVHLPLIIPPGCGFRVGGETRSWQEGKAWVFDDTIEHEAWNRSEELRAILILDVWNPHIAPDERDMLRTFYAASADATDAPTERLQIGE